MMKRFTIAVLAAAFLFVAAIASAQPTAVTVRVISKGAKFVGTSMGGALVIIRDADTGEILAQGVTEGSTGDTGKIMKEPYGRHGVLSSDGSAAFTAELDLEAPRRIEVSATGPLAQRQAANTVTATQWVIPGKPLTGGDGFLLELPGFVVDVLGPASHSMLGSAPREVTLEANVTMMCGCPVTPGGLWDADAFEVTAILFKDGVQVGELPLGYAGTASRFSGVWKVGEPGTYEAMVYAYDPADGNTGLDSTTFMITP